MNVKGFKDTRLISSRVSFVWCVWTAWLLPNRKPPGHSIDEVLQKYEADTKVRIADVPNQRKESGHHNTDLAEIELQGRFILGVSEQKKLVPKEVLDHASKKGVKIRDEKNGHVLNPEPL